jgi:hypothetical protein
MPETAQPAPETDEKKSRGLGSYVIWGFVAVVVYVLSSGPLARYEIKTGTAPPILDAIYSPLGWLSDNTMLHKPLALYWHVWCPEYLDKNGHEIR